MPVTSLKDTTMSLVHAHCSSYSGMRNCTCSHACDLTTHTWACHTISSHLQCSKKSLPGRCRLSSAHTSKPSEVFISTMIDLRMQTNTFEKVGSQPPRCLQCRTVTPGPPSSP